MTAPAKKIGRPKGARNNQFRTPLSQQFLRMFPKDVRTEGLSIAELTGLPLDVVLLDALKEGFACCRVDLYSSLIKARARAGKVIREREEQVPQTHEIPSQAVASTDDIPTGETPVGVDEGSA